MPYATRSQIIEQYGFDPMTEKPPGGVSVVPMNIPPGTPDEDEERYGAAAPIEVTEEKDKQRNLEKPSAGPLSNVSAGAIKSVFSDPFLVYGLGAGIADYALGKVGVGKDEDFLDSLYEGNGAEEVRQHMQGYANNVKEQHPDWTREQVLEEVDRYRMTDDFFNFNTDRLRPGLSRGLKEAYEINKAFGVNKRPEEETSTDVILQALGAVGVPNPIGGPIASLAARAVTRGTQSMATRAAGRALSVADALIMPGTSIGRYGPTALGIGTGVNASIDQILRTAQGDPNIIRGDAMWDFSKINAQMPNETPITPPQPGAGMINPDRVVTQEEFDERWSAPAVAAGAAGIAAVGGAGAIGRRLARRFQPNVPPNQVGPPPGTVGPTRADQADEAMRNRGFEPEADRSDWDRATDFFETGINRDTPVEHAAREIGGLDLEDTVQAVIGTTTARHAVAAGFDNYMTTGRMPDAVIGMRPRDWYLEQQRANPDDLQTFYRGVNARNELDARDDVLDLSYQQHIEATDRMNTARASGDPQRIADAQVELDRTTDRINRHIRDDPTARPAFREVDSAQLRQMEQAMMNNPNARRLLDGMQRLNTELTNMQVRMGTLTREEGLRRLQRPWSSSIFESPTMGVRELVRRQGVRGMLRGRTQRWLKDANLDPDTGRNIDFEFDDPRIAVEWGNEINPAQSFALRAAHAVRFAQQESGKRQILRLLADNDPRGRLVQYVGPRDNLPNGIPRSGYTVLAPINGVPHVWQVARKDIADSINQEALDNGLAFGIGNEFRKAYQMGTTGPLSPKALRTAVRSFFFDSFAAGVFRPQGTSFGPLGSTLRRITMGRMPRTVNFLDATLTPIDLPLAVIQSAVRVPITAYDKMMGNVAQRWMDQAISQRGLMGMIARTGPQGEAFVRNMGESMWRGFERTGPGMMTRYNAFNSHSMMNDAYNSVVRTDKLIQRYASAERSSIVKRALQSTWLSWRSGLDNIHNAPKLTWIAQNIAVQEARYGVGNVPPEVLRRLAQQANDIAGPMQGMPGKATWNVISAWMPYGNITAQALRYVTNAAFNQGTQQSTLVATRLAGVVGLAYAGYKTIEAMGLTDWFFENVNDWERSGIPIPTAKALIHFARNGTWYRPDPKKEDPREWFDIVPLSPEFSAYVTPFLIGMEYLGLLNRGRNLGETSMGKDARGIVSNIVGIGSSPPIAVVGALTGQQFAVGNLVSGRQIATDTPKQRGLGIQSDESPGGLPAWQQIGEVSKAVFGFAGGMITTAMDAGAQVHKQGGQVNDVAWRMWGSSMDEYKKGLPVVPGLWKAEQQVYKTTPVSQRVFDSFQKMKELDAQWTNEFSPANARIKDRRRVADREVKKLLAESHAWYRQGGMLKLQKVVTDINRQIDNLPFTKGRQSDAEIAQQKRELVKKLQVRQEQVAIHQEKFDQRLMQKYKDRFEREGLTPDLGGLVELVDRYTQ